MNEEAPVNKFIRKWCKTIKKYTCIYKQKNYFTVKKILIILSVFTVYINMNRL